MNNLPALVKGALKSKLVNLGLWLAVFSFLQTQLPVIQASIPADVYNYGGMLLGLVIVVLRFWTTQPLDEKGTSQ